MDRPVSVLSVLFRCQFIKFWTNIFLISVAPLKIQIWLGKYPLYTFLFQKLSVMAILGPLSFLTHLIFKNQHNIPTII